MANNNIIYHLFKNELIIVRIYGHKREKAYLS